MLEDSQQHSMAPFRAPVSQTEVHSEVSDPPLPELDVQPDVVPVVSPLENAPGVNLNPIQFHLTVSIDSFWTFAVVTVPPYHQQFILCGVMLCNLMFSFTLVT